MTAVQKAVLDGKRSLVKVPLNKDNSFPHRIDGYFGAAKVPPTPLNTDPLCMFPGLEHCALPGICCRFSFRSKTALHLVHVRSFGTLRADQHPARDVLTPPADRQVMLRPAAEGTGVIAGGAVRVVLELAGVKNAFGKQLGSDSPLNNARATLTAISGMRTFKEVSADRGISVQELMGLNQEKKGAAQASMSSGSEP